MKFRFWVMLGSVVLVAGCGMKSEQITGVDSNHGKVLDATPTKFKWGPPAPEPPLMPSVVPQIPEQPKSPMNPGDGPKAEDKLIPSTSAPAAPK